MPYIARSIAILLLFLFPTTSMADSSQLNALATALVGKNTVVNCYPYNPDGDAAGYVFLTKAALADGWSWDGQIYLTGEACGALQNVLTPGPRTARWLRSFDGSATVGQAFMYLVHEATHAILLSSDEGLVECTAYRNVWNYTKLLSLPSKLRKSVYEGAKYNHFSKPTTGPEAEYRSVC